MPYGQDGMSWEEHCDHPAKSEKEYHSRWLEWSRSKSAPALFHSEEPAPHLAEGHAAGSTPKPGCK